MIPERKFTHIGLFEGIGGFSLAASWMGWKTIAWCEINPFCQKVLKHHFPKAIPHEDIKTTDFSIYRGQCDIISGGFPCQAFSVAGKRKGKEDDRYLWPFMLRAIREIQPRWIVGENVPGLINWSRGMVLKEIKADLEDSGFEIIATLIIPACGKNAPHRRDRLWIVANSKNIRCKQWQASNKWDTKQFHKSEQRGDEKNGSQFSRHYKSASHTSDKGLQRSKDERITNGGGKNRNKQFTGLFRTDWQDFPIESPVCSGDDGISEQLDLDAISKSKWRTESLKAAGNAIVPQVVYEIFKAIEMTEQMMIEEQNLKTECHNEAK